jgi:hypothetical protein
MRERLASLVLGEPVPRGNSSLGLGSAAQVTTESSASGIAALDLVTPDDILGADGDLQRAFVLNRYATFGVCAFGHHPFATN